MPLGESARDCHSFKPDFRAFSSRYYLRALRLSRNSDTKVLLEPASCLIQQLSGPFDFRLRKAVQLFGNESRIFRSFLYNLVQSRRNST
jgi:hypothetical protein